MTRMAGTPTRASQPPMRHALFIAPFGELSDPVGFAEVAALAEASGWDALFAWDHMWRTESRVDAVGDVWISLAAAACRTQRLRLGPMVVPLARRRPQKVARESVALDLLSHGRLTLGVGLGVDTDGELARFGEEARDRERAARLDEAIELLVGLWSGTTVHHHGTHFVADGVAFHPVPIQRPRIPLWGAARGDRGMAPVRRAARLDGLFPVGASLEQLRAMAGEVARVRGTLEGFDIAAVPPEGATVTELADAGVTWSITATGESASAAAVRRVAAGPPGGPG